jgi:hypothetical protein
LGDCLERREQTRYRVRALVDFNWLDKKGLRRQGRGLTRDISTRGMFIYSSSQPPAKADVEVEVFFRSVTEAVKNIRMKAESLVIRVESAMTAGTDHGFAILNRSFRLRERTPQKDLDRGTT